MVLIALSLLITFIFVLTDYGSYLMYGSFKVVSLLVHLFFNCFILLGVLMLYMKLKLTSVMKGSV